MPVLQRDAAFGTASNGASAEAPATDTPTSIFAPA